jgi:hypothetical protein
MLPGIVNANTQRWSTTTLAELAAKARPAS